MVLASVKVPQPSISSILFFFIRKWTPLTMESETSRLRAWVGLKSIEASPVIPNLSFSWVEDVRQLGVAQQRLRRDAADVEADTSPVLLLDHPDLEAELGGADGGDVPTGAGTEDDDIEITHGGEPIPPGQPDRNRCEPNRRRATVEPCAS